MAIKLLFSAGAKGGTGKSTALRFLIDWYQTNGIEPFLIDCDDDSATMSRYFPQARKVDPNIRRSIDVLMELAERGEHPLMLADLKAGVGSQMLNWFADVPFDELKTLGITLVCVGVITSSPDSVSSFLRWVNFLGGQVSYVVFKNLKDSDASGEKPENVILPEYEKTKQAAEFRRLYKPVEIVMPALDPDYMGELERASLTIRAALDRTAKIPRSLDGILPRSRLRNYQNALFEKFMAHKEVFLP